MNNKIFYYIKEADDVVAGKYVNPVTCEIDLTTVCQNNCYFCVNKESNKESHSIIDFQVCRKLIYELKDLGVKSITFTGGGEPLLHPLSIEIISLASSLGFKLGLITNGINLDKIEIVLDLFEFIRVSLYGVDRFSYQQKTGKDNFNKVINNVRNVIKKRKEVVVGFSYVLLKNDNTFERAKKLAEDVGVDYIQFKPILGEDISDVGNDKRTFLTNRYDPDSTLPCKIAGLIGIVSADCNVYFCCMKRGQNKYCLGNLKDDSFENLWKKRKYIEVDLSECSSCRYMNYAKGYLSVKESEKHFLKHRDFL